MGRVLRIGVTAALAMFVNSAVAGSRIHEERVHVQFLAAGTLMRGNWGPNEDTYLAELTLPVHGELVLVRLIDEYANEAPALSRAMLTSPSGAFLWVRRDSLCDYPYRQMLLRTAPGDPLAILPEKLNYQPHLEIVPAPDSILQCYRVARR